MDRERESGAGVGVGGGGDGVGDVISGSVCVSGEDVTWWSLLTL